MFIKGFLYLTFLLSSICVFAQKNTNDTTIIPDFDITAVDTTIDYESLFSDFDAFMDSILTPRSHFLGSLYLGKGYYSFSDKSSYTITSKQKLNYSPSLGYYHKNGLGIAGVGYIVDDGENMNLYQTGFIGSYDYLDNKKIATGISYTRYFTKDSLPFYTTPLENELYAYFQYRKSWFKPSVAVSYGWGNRNDFEKREELIQDLRIRRRGFTYINTTESVSDFSLMASVRHDFYWLDVFGNNDYLRVAPQLTFVSGTQNFGFNQSSTTYVTAIRNANNILYNSDNVFLDDNLLFQPLSLTLFLKTEYSIGKFFIQPQFIVDYYFPAAEKKLNSLFSVTTGFLF